MTSNKVKLNLHRFSSSATFLLIGPWASNFKTENFWIDFNSLLKEFFCLLKTPSGNKYHGKVSQKRSGVRMGVTVRLDIDIQGLS